MKNLIFLLFIPLLHIHCSPQTYHLHIGESFYPATHELTSSGGSGIAAARPDTILEVTGVYCDKNVFLDKYPVIRFYSRDKGRVFIPLSAKLPCQDGSLLKIKGKVINLPITYPLIKKTLYSNHLEPLSYTILSDNQKIIKEVNDEYQKIKEDLQTRITIEQSKLQLSLHPEWDIWFDKQKKIFIFHSHQYDLMYAADIEFIVTAGSKKVIDVYAKEWFKGEM